MRKFHLRAFASSSVLTKKLSHSMLTCWTTSRRISLDAQPKQHADQAVVDPREHAPQHCVVAVDAKAGDHLVLVHQRKEVLELRDVELIVGVHEKHVVVPGAGDTCPQRSAIAAIGVMRQQPDLVLAVPDEALDHPTSSIRAAVVDHDHLVLLGEAGSGGHALLHAALDVGLLVVRGKHDREARNRCAAGAPVHGPKYMFGGT